MTRSPTNQTLFDDEHDAPELPVLKLGEGAMLLRRFAAGVEQRLFEAVQSVAAEAPLRHMSTPGGRQMSAAMTNCGRAGWVSDKQGYRYAKQDPLSGKEWPAIPSSFLSLATEAARAGGFENFEPDVCLINRYQPGARMALHQDKDEKQFEAPIVSVSLGLPMTFLWGGQRRSDPARKVRLESGDIVVWGGPSRLVYHGVATLAEGEHALTGRCRINLTFRRAF